MILDFLSLNLTNILLCSVLVNIFYLTDKKVYFILGIDILLNGIPFTTILIILLYYLNNFIFKFISKSFLTKYLLIIIYYLILSFIVFFIPLIFILSNMLLII